MTSYYDSLETRDPEQREQDLMARLARQLRACSFTPNRSPTSPAAVVIFCEFRALPNDGKVIKDQRTYS